MDFAGGYHEPKAALRHWLAVTPINTHHQTTGRARRPAPPGWPCLPSPVAISCQGVWFAPHRRNKTDHPPCFFAPPRVLSSFLPVLYLDLLARRLSTRDRTPGIHDTRAPYLSVYLQPACAPLDSIPRLLLDHKPARDSNVGSCRCHLPTPRAAATALRLVLPFPGQQRFSLQLENCHGCLVRQRADPANRRESL